MKKNLPLIIIIVIIIFGISGYNKYIEYKIDKEYPVRKYTEKELEQRRKYSEEFRKKEIQDNYRKKAIEKQFSKWNGSHIKLTKLIKDNMHDSDSYEHIETKFRDDKNSIFVTTKYRGKNAFGAKVINTTSVKTDIEGNIIEVN